MKFSLEYKWRPVESAPQIRYCFPEDISPFFRANWGGPAVYRWIVFDDKPGDLKRLYVGQAESLPRRIYGYLNPGPTQFTNQRLKAEFEKELSSQRKVTLEVLTFDPFDIDGVPISMPDLSDKTVRGFLESLFVAYYARAGYAILNA